MQKLLKYLWKKIQNNARLRKTCAKIYNGISKNHKTIRGKGNKINYENAFLKKVSINIIGNNNNVTIKQNVHLINTNILIIGDNHKIEIDENCIIRNSGFCFEDDNCKIVIGKRTTAEGIQVASLESNSSITIGDDCMFSAGISIRNSDSHSIIDIKTNKRINQAKDIVIGNHTWIGEAVRILKGSVIGNNCVIGVGSIVTKLIPNNCVAVGIPAKVVKENTTWTRKRL